MHIDNTLWLWSKKEKKKKTRHWISGSLTISSLMLFLAIYIKRLQKMFFPLISGSDES